MDRNYMKLEGFKPSRASNGDMAIAILLLLPVIILLVLMVNAWFIMLGLGILAEYFAMGQFSYWDSFFIAIGLRLVFLAVGPTISASKK